MSETPEKYQPPAEHIAYIKRIGDEANERQRQRKQDERFAAAGPDMLAALKAVVKAWDHSDLSEVSVAVKKAQDAIAKAEGGA